MSDRANTAPTAPRRLRGAALRRWDNLGELLLALAVGAFGVAVVWQTTRIRVTPAYSNVGPRVIPYIVGSGLIVLALWLAAEALTGRATRPTADSEDADPSLPTDWPTIALLGAALVVYLLLIERAGFVIASGLLFFGATFAMGSRRIVLDLAIGFALSLAIYLVFTRALDLRLPAGVLSV